MTTTVLLGDCREVLATLPAESIHCVITSPPYYGLRAYSDDPREIGREPTPEQYITNMVAVFREVRRVLRADGVLWLNLGDSYANTPSGSAQRNFNGDGYDGGRGTSNTSRRTNNDAKGIPDGAKPKDLLLIPHRVALALQADGWYLRSTLPWLKRNAMPESVTDRPTTAHEYVFLLTRSPRYWYDADAVRVKAVTTGDHRALRTDNTQSNGRNGDASRKTTGTPTRTHRSYRTTDPWFDSLDALIEQQRAYVAHLERIRERGGLLSDDDGEPLALPINPQPYTGSHFAVFPERLVDPLMRAGCPAECCPTCGAGYVRVVEKTNTGHDDTRPFRSEPTGVMPTRRRAGDVETITTAIRPACDCAVLPPIPGTVLDPFYGSGTVGRVAERLNRDCVGIELNVAYTALQDARIDGVQKELL